MMWRSKHSVSNFLQVLFGKNGVSYRSSFFLKSLSIKAFVRCNVVINYLIVAQYLDVDYIYNCILSVLRHNALPCSQTNGWCEKHGAARNSP